MSWGMPLWFTAMSGRHEIAELLLARGADVNAIVAACGDALGIAGDTRDDEMVTLLRKHGARVTVEGVAGDKDLKAAQAILDGTTVAEDGSSLTITDGTTTQTTIVAVSSVTGTVSVDTTIDSSSGTSASHDFTAIHAMQERLQRNERLSAMGEMAAGLAHQLRTPLATAMLYTVNLTDPALKQAERVDFAQKVLWSEGMFLTPHHFQQSERHLEHLLQRRR